MTPQSLLLAFLGLASTAYGVKYTVTDEAWFEVEIKGDGKEIKDYKGKFTIALFGKIVPATVLNFVALTQGYPRADRKLSYKNTPIHRIVADFVIQMGDITIGDGTGEIKDLDHWKVERRHHQNHNFIPELSYKDTIVHRVIPDFVIQMGDIVSKDGLGSTSIYGDRFNDEKFTLSHRSPGWVAMANHGKNTNGSQFFILLSRARWLDNKHIVFGKVIRGMKTVETVGNVKANPDTAVPETKVTIVDCGLNKLEKPYDISSDDLDSTEDL